MEESHTIVIEPGWHSGHYWRDIWRSRELFYFLSWRDVLVRYKQTALGIAWSVIRPLLTMLVFSVLFGSLSKLPSHGAPYPILVMSAMLPWQFFANALTDGGSSLIYNASILTKIYFPRLIIPASSLLVSLIDFLISMVILGLMMAWYGLAPSWHIIALPLLTLFLLIVSLGFSVWLAALNVKYRDFRHVVPFIVQLGLYLSPVGFTTAVIPSRWRLLYALNPMVGVIDGFRWAILGDAVQLDWRLLAISLALALCTFFYGLRYFRATEAQFADIV